MDKRFLAIVSVIILAFVGVIIFSRRDASAPADANGAQATNHVKGDNAKNVTLVEYGDFECPACQSYEPIVQAVYQKYQADIQFQFRHFPLQSIHKNAFAGSRAAEAAGNQGKFWEMHDLLYANQTSWKSADTPQTFFEQYASSLKLDMTKYKADFASEKTKDIINADLAAGEKLQVNETPTFFLDGKKVDKAKLAGDTQQATIDNFGKLIEEAIKAKQ